MEILNLLRRKEKASGSFPMISAIDAINRITKAGREGISLTNTIITVDFARTPSFRDTEEATMCVVVLTSDAKKGSLTHLIPDADVEKFTMQLKKYHTEPAAACLVGGEDRTSEKIINEIYDRLPRLGFSMPSETCHSDTGGIGVDRRATLYADKVRVKRYSSPDSIQTFELKFPNIKKEANPSRRLQ